MDWYPHHIADFNQATRHLDRTERSIYRDLLDLYYDTEEPLPGDPAKLARLILANDCLTTVEQVLNEFFEFVDGVYRNGRCDGIIAEYQERQAQRSAAGKASARARRRARNDRSTSVKRPSNKPQPQPQPHIDSANALPDWLNERSWKEFVQHRKEMRQPLTDLAVAKALKQLEGLTAEQQARCIDNTIQNRWRGLFPDKVVSKEGGKASNGKLRLPQSDDALMQFAERHKLPKPDYGQDFPGYRAKLRNYLELNDL